MTKQSDTPRHLPRRSLALAALCLAAAGAAHAQPVQPMPRPDAPPSLEVPPDSHEGPVAEDDLDALFERLADAEEGAHERIEENIQRLWSRSGSDTMDLLLRRGRDALNEGEGGKAIQHFSALVEHAPDFAEGWNMRATAFYLEGEFGMSLGDIERTLALEPRHWPALTGLGMILEQLGRDADALTAYEEAVRVNPHADRAQEGVERLAPRVEGRDI